VRDADLLALEHAAWRALCGPGAADWYRERLADDAVMVFPFGVLDREQSLAAIAGAPPWAEYRIEKSRTVALPGGGALVYHARARRPGAEPFEAWIASVWIAGRLALHQQSFASPEP